MIIFSNDTFREFFQLKQVLGFAILPCVLPSLLLLLLFWSLSLHFFNYKATCPPINIVFFVVVDDFGFMDRNWVCENTAILYPRSVSFSLIWTHFVLELISFSTAMLIYIIYADIILSSEVYYLHFSSEWRYIFVYSDSRHLALLNLFMSLKTTCRIWVFF